MRIIAVLLVDGLSLLVTFSASSFADDNYKVLGNYKELDYAIEGVDENSVGVTDKDIERTVRLRLLKNGIKPIAQVGKHFLYVNVNIMDIRGGYAASIHVDLSKFSSDYVSPDHGASNEHIPYSFVSGEINTLFVGSKKSHVLEQVEEEMDEFILKYLEANMEASSPQNSYNTPNPTHPTSNGRNTPLLPRLP